MGHDYGRFEIISSMHGVALMFDGIGTKVIHLVTS